jgi:iron complex outermembrane receptor protein
MNHFSSKLLVMTGIFYGHLLLPAYAGMLATELPTGELIDLDLESLMDIEVYSASKKTQRLKDVSSAVFVINQDMIHKSGLTEIPELLRLAPGVQVSRINGNAWSVSIRGGSGRYGDKLLVMIDGRSIYTLLYAGVYWENQDMVLDDIERIEVIRGPGATLWGANAVNGVINIITKNASETQGSHVAVSSGTINKALIGVRYGDSINDETDYRLSLKYRDQAQLELRDGSNNYDGSNIGHGDFRGDWTPSPTDSLTFQGGFYNGCN